MNEYKSSLGARLMEYRISQGLSQDEIAELCGVSRGMWGKYERDIAIPGGEVLTQLVLRGADVAYILAGRHSPESAAATDPATGLRDDQKSLLDAYEQSSPEGQDIIRGTAMQAAEARRTKRRA